MSIAHVSVDFSIVRAGVEVATATGLLGKFCWRAPTGGDGSEPPPHHHGGSTDPSQGIGSPGGGNADLRLHDRQSLSWDH